MANDVYYHLIYAFATENRSAFATVCGDMFLQAGYGHGHFVRQGSLLGARELPQAEQATHAITGLLKLPFEPSMLWTADSIGRRGAHQAPVENVEEQCSRKANKKQILFSPFIRSKPWQFLVSEAQASQVFVLPTGILDALQPESISFEGVNNLCAEMPRGTRVIH